MKRFAVILLAAAVLVGSAWPASAQFTAATKTTLSAAVTYGATTITVASATGFTVDNYVYTDGELMRIRAISGTTITVTRGQSGTMQRAHRTSRSVYTGNLAHFQSRDPDYGATCTDGTAAAGAMGTNAVYQPWVNILTGTEWYCQSTGRWGGFNVMPITWASTES